MFPRAQQFVKLRTKISRVSSEDPEYRAEQLLYQDNISPETGWLSERYCAYPQDIDFLLLEQSPCVREIRILCHEENIATRIEVFAGSNRNKDNPGIINGVAERGDIQFERVGSCTLTGPRHNSKEAVRELKSLVMKVNCYVIRIRLHKCFVSRRNVHNQVGLVGVMLFGIPNRVQGLLIQPSQTSTTDDLNEVSDPHPFVAAQVSKIRAAKQSAVHVENFERAHILKESEGYFLQVGRTLDTLERQKMQYVLEEDFRAASKVKEKIEQLQSRIIIHVTSTMQTLNLPNFDCNNQTTKRSCKLSVDERAATEAAAKLLKPLPEVSSRQRGGSMIGLELEIAAGPKPDDNQPLSPYSNQTSGVVLLSPNQDDNKIPETFPANASEEDKSRLVLGVPGTQLLPNPVPINVRSSEQCDIAVAFGEELLYCAFSQDHWGLRHIALTKLTTRFESGEFNKCRNTLQSALAVDCESDQKNPQLEPAWSTVLQFAKSALYLAKHGYEDTTVNVVKASSTLLWVIVVWLRPIIQYLPTYMPHYKLGGSPRRDNKGSKHHLQLRHALTSVIESMEQRLVDWNLRIVHHVVEQFISLSGEEVVGAVQIVSVLLIEPPIAQDLKQKYFAKRHIISRLQLVVEIIRKSECQLANGATLG